MKIIFWNLLALTSTKLANKINHPSVVSCGNNVGNFIVKVVMGDDVWHQPSEPSISPVDIFVIIELYAGCGEIGNELTDGNAVICLQEITNVMNVSCNKDLYCYAYVNPKITGKARSGMECVGVIYNTVKLQNIGASVLKDDSGKFIPKKSPFLVQFKDISSPPGKPVNVVGIHAPPPNGTGKTTMYIPPLNYLQKLKTVAALKPDKDSENYMYVIGGDFNCQPLDVCIFDSCLSGYITAMARDTLTSVRNTIDNDQVGNAKYLNAAYDNIFYNMNFDVIDDIHQNALDLISILISEDKSLNFSAKKAILDRYRWISDHLPVQMVY